MATQTRRKTAGITLRPEALKPNISVTLEENEEVDWTPPDIRVLQKGIRIDATNGDVQAEVTIWQDNPDNHNIVYVGSTIAGRHGTNYEPASDTTADCMQLSTTVETLELLAHAILRAIDEGTARGMITRR